MIFIIIYDVLSHFSNFTSNVAMNQSSVLAFRVPVTFEGINIFSGNMGGAVTLITARMKSKGTILFENNHAAEGGAVTLVDSALVITLENCLPVDYGSTYSQQVLL